jgi:hypothetical protein
MSDPAFIATIRRFIVRKTFAALTATLVLAVASPALADEAQKSSFTHEGITYTYSQTKVGKATIIEGQAKPGQKFRFVKSGKQVTGTFNGSAVSFRTDELIAYTPSNAIPLASR